MTDAEHNPAKPQTQDYADKANPPPFTYGCVCSGISAPTLAAKLLGWRTKFFSEIEAFPRAVLTHHYSSIPLHHDFTTINGETYGTVDLLVGGTPCQSFSVAGKRLGLDDPRGNLALEYVRLAKRLDAKWMVFENVPGLLSSAGGEDFATFISAVTGVEYRSPATGWQNAGIAVGKSDRFGIAWRILDAQYFGVAQRRRRLFVVGYRGDWRPAAAVLLEPESMRGDSAPSRKAGKAVAATLAARTTAGGGLGTDFEIDGGLVTSKCPAEIASTLNAHYGNKMGLENQHVNEGCPLFLPVAHTLRGDGFDASEDGTGRGTPLIVEPSLTPWEGQGTRIHDIAGTSPTLTSNPAGGMKLDPILTYPINTQMALRGAETSNSSREGIGVGEEGDPGFTLQANHSHAIALSLRGRDGGATAELGGDVMPSIRASQGGGDKPHILQGVTIHGTDKTTKAASYTDLAGSLRTKPPGSIENSSTTAMLHGSSVRRLTPTECERLQGMPDDLTRIAWRGKPADQCPDGPRYKAIGNSMAVPVMRWIFERIDFVKLVNQIDAA